MANKIINGNCLEVIKTLKDNSIDAVVTDPPYGLSFMGKKWDYDVPKVEIWQECLRVLKPGGYLLAFAGTRTQHRMAVRIEDAGFEIRDMIAWIYGSGFPKSLNIGKAVDKIQGNEREVVGELKLTGTARNTKTIGAKTSSALTSDYEINNTKTNITKGTSEWEGWGTALKPALEPITVARKPIEGTVAENCLKWGVGGINIDGCRVEGLSDKELNWTPQRYNEENRKSENVYANGKGFFPKEEMTMFNSSGRFPANLIHDGSDEVVELFPNTKSIQRSKPSDTISKPNIDFGGGWKSADNEYSDSGSASRFFYCAKASKSERNRGCEGMEEKDATKMDGGKFESASTTATERKMKNNHPTVKPIALMEYLVKLVSKEGHTVLDPFMGSGSTGIACKKLGREFIGIELEPDYVEIAKARIESYKVEPEQEILWQIK